MTDGSNRQTQRFQDVDFNINKKQMGVLLATAAKSGSRDVRELAKTIVKDGVDKVTGAHSGGHGGGRSRGGSNAALHRPRGQEQLPCLSEEPARKVADHQDHGLIKRIDGLP